MNDNGVCYQCKVLGKDCRIDENGEQVSNCDECSFGRKDDERSE